jgi:hypothetical protein
MDEAGKIPSRARQAGNEANANRVGNNRKLDYKRLWAPWRLSAGALLRGIGFGGRDRINDPINKLTAALRILGVPVIWILHASARP